MPLDGLPAKCEPQSGSGEFFPVQTLKHPEDAFLEFRLYAWTVVFDGEDPTGIDLPG
jgi:hypothetical protein